MILHVYFARRFLATFLVVALALSFIYMLLDTVEHIRRFDMGVIGLIGILRLTLLNLPGAVYQILPLIVILATLFLFLALARSSEMVVARASGRSALLALIAPAAVVLAIGGLALAMLNPIAAATTKEYKRLEALYGGGAGSVLSLSSEGLWLRQGDMRGQMVIRAQGVESGAGGEVALTGGVTFFAFDPDGSARLRIDAARAELGEGRWALRDAKVWTLTGTGNPERQARSARVWFVATTLRPDDITDNLNDKARIPVWDLPDYIARLKQAGFSPRRHEVALQVELAMPLFLLSMLLIGAAFTMRHTRFGQTGPMVLFALLLGFGIYFVRNFAQILGENGQIPVLVAAWTPPVAAIMLALGLILHLEDG